MDTTIRNLDGAVYREAKARAALEDKTIGEIVSEALRAYLRGRDPLARDRTLADLEPQPYPEGNERLSEEVDTIVYGRRS